MSTEIASSRLRRARLGVSLLFMANGAMWANVVPRLPEIRERLDVGYTAFGLAVGFGTVGGIVLGLIAASSVRRFGSARVAAIALALQAIAVLAAATSHSVWLFAGFLFLNGALDANTDVAQNAQGMGLQRALKRSIINSLHAMWSAGAAVGGLLGVAAIGLGLSITTHALIATVIFLAVAIAGYRLMLGPGTGIDREQPESAPADSGQRRLFASRAALVAVGMLGLVAIAGAAVEDAGFTWSSSYLKDELGASGEIAGMGLVGLMALHFIGRIAGDRLVDRFGERAVARTGGAVTAIGMAVALAWPTIPGTIIGFSLAGLGVATTVPAAFAASDDVPGLKHGTGITLVSWMLRISFLAGPPLVGFIGDHVSLRVGLLTVPLAGLAVVFLAASLHGRDDAPSPSVAARVDI